MDLETNNSKYQTLVDLMLLQILLLEILIYNNYLSQIQKIILFKKIKKMMQKIKYKQIRVINIKLVTNLAKLINKTNYK